MKKIHTIWLLCVALSVSVFANVILARTNYIYFDEAYGQLAQQHLLNTKVRSQLEQGDVVAAKTLLDQVIENKGSILAVCLMEACSSSAQEILRDAGNL
ncbi:hypothetical protein [Saccharospirillum salsuginis]|uniref:hypothetical protein n=1 Tax=Saccharospirillum salsuginis TaxID=418750 RepID=UPI001672A08F|nr:hypothetical protein [Saccharospirillum salsuginis]